MVTVMVRAAVRVGSILKLVLQVSHGRGAESTFTFLSPLVGLAPTLPLIIALCQTKDRDRVPF